MSHLGPPVEPGTLHVVGTPIGNLRDLGERALATLREVDLVAAEDTRRTGRLLAAIGIEKRMVSLHEGNERERLTEVMGVLRAGRSVALVSDGGMPVVSDPGFLLVRECLREGLPVRVVPGPSAVLAALVVSGLPPNRFVFEGFLPRRGSDRQARLVALATEERTAVLFESPRRVASTLEDLLGSLGDRDVALCRELTKLHEEVLRGPLSEVLDLVRDRDLKGEVVLVIAGAEAEPPDAEAAVREARDLVEGGMRRREAAREVARRRGVPANVVYDALVERDR